MYLLCCETSLPLATFTLQALIPISAPFLLMVQICKRKQLISVSYVNAPVSRNTPHTHKDFLGNCSKHYRFSRSHPISPSIHWIKSVLLLSSVVVLLHCKHLWYLHAFWDTAHEFWSERSLSCRSSTNETGSQTKVVQIWFETIRIVCPHSLCEHILKNAEVFF